MRNDLISNGRPALNLQIGTGHSDTDVILCIKNEAGTSVTAKALGDGSLTVTNINISNIPTSASGLNSGDVWSNSGILTIVS